MASDRRHIVWLILDSARYDAVVAAATPNMDRLGAIEERWAYATWTAPSHYTFVMGLVPHRAPQGVFASEVYKEDYLRWRDRIGPAGGELAFRSFLPALSLPRVLQGLGYRSTAFVSLPVLNPSTALARDFDRYELWPKHNDFAGMIDELAFPDGEPQFYFLNLGETHYPYMLQGEEPLPHISGVHGVVKKLDRDGLQDQGGAADGFFDEATMQRLRAKQVECVEHVDRQLGRLYEKAPSNTWFIVTADHGEAFGEGGFFGHGPVTDPVVLRVPYVEGPHPDGR